MRLANLEINKENMEDVIENLKYSSNKLTQILWHELESNGVKEYKLKPETLKKIKEEDCSSYYDKNNIEMIYEG